MNRPPADHLALLNALGRWRGPLPEGFAVDFLGVRTRLAFCASPSAQPWFCDARRDGTPAQPPWPTPDADTYFEYLSALDAAAAAAERGDRFVMVELGAGWGRWLAVGAAAAHKLSPAMPVTLVGVEAEPAHFAMLRTHLRDNALDPAQHRLIAAAVAADDGVARFTVGDAHGWWGQQVVHDPSPRWLAERPAARVADVPAVSLRTVLRDLPTVDLIDLDIQGLEADVIDAAIDELNAKVRRVHIGTHRPLIDQRVRTLLRGAGWRPLFDFACHGTSDTPVGPVAFDDGVQAWINPRLATSRLLDRRAAA